MRNLSGTNTGRYLLGNQLDVGGMAVVYKAKDLTLGVNAAVKFIRMDDLPTDQIQRTINRFRVEARKMAALSHSNIVPVTDFGEFEGIPYLVMPLLTGGSLKKFIGAQMDWRTAVSLMAPVADALAYTHSKDIIHRDVKPANILLSESGNPMLTDFGIAKIVDMGEARQMTLTGMIVGTPEYMAPEQYLSTKFDQRVDIYALGIVLYELITGRKPFIADTPPAVMIKHARDPLPNPKSFAPNLPDEVEQLLVKALAKRPQDRFRDMGEIARQLHQLALLIPETERQQAQITRQKEELSAARKQEKDYLRRQAALKLEQEQARKQADAEQTRLAREKKRQAEQAMREQARIEKERLSAVKGKEKFSQSSEEKPRAVVKVKKLSSRKTSQPDEKKLIKKRKVILFSGIALVVVGWISIVLFGIKIEDVLGVKNTPPPLEMLSVIETNQPSPAASETPEPAVNFTPSLNATVPLEQDLADYVYVWMGSNEQPININNGIQVTSARAVYTPDGVFQVEIYFNDLPETMELGNPIPAGQSLSPGEQLIENLWYVNFDFDGDPNTGINESFGNEQGVDAGLWLANYTDTQLKIELETFRDWGMKEYLVVDEGGESYIHTRPMQDYRFDATENKLIIRDKIAEINYKTRIRVGFEGGNPNIQSFIDMELATIQENANLFGEINEEIGEQVCADSAMFISETIPDNTIFKPLQPFTKTWTSSQ